MKRSRKKVVPTPRRRWRVNPVTRVAPSAKRYSRAQIRTSVRKMQDEDKAT